MILKYLTPELANTLVENSAIEVLMALYSRHKVQVYVSLIMHLMTYQTSKKLNVISLFRLSQLSPVLYDVCFQQLEAISELPSDPKTDNHFENFVGFLISICK